MNVMADSARVTLETSGTSCFFPPESMPLGGLGLPLSEEGSPAFDALYLSALEQVTVPPAVSVGLDFPLPPNGGNPGILGVLWSTLFEQSASSSAPRGLDPEHPALKPVDFEGANLAHLLPIIDLPGTGDFWIYEEHLSQLLCHFAEGRVTPEALREPGGFPSMPGLVLPYRLPKANGAVTPQNIEAFAQHFPGVVSFLKSALPWQGKGKQRQVPARTANGLASRALGIPVDLRVGSLVSEGCVHYAINSAAADVVHRCMRNQTDRLEDFVSLILPTVDEYDERIRQRRLSGAVWSCMLDAVLNDTYMWTAGEDGRLPWADDVPELKVPSGRKAWLSRIMRAASCT